MSLNSGPRLAKPLSFRQARLAIGVAVTLGGIFAVLQINADLSDEKQRIANVGHHTLSPVLGSMSRAAYRLDEVVADELAQGILEEPSVLRIRILDDFGETLAEANRPAQGGSPSVFAFLLSDAPFVTKADLVVQPEDLHVGHVELVIDPEIAAQAFFRRVALNLVSVMANSLGLTIALTFLFYWTVTRRLENMAAPFRNAAGSTVPRLDGDELNALDQVIRDWRQQSEAAIDELGAAAERMRLAEEVAKFGIWEWTLSDNALRWDEGMHALYGTDPATFKNSEQDWASQLHPDDRARVLQAVQHALSGSDTLDHMYRVTRKDEGAITVHAVARIERDTAGQAIRMTGINIDVTKEDALRAELDTMHRVEALGALSAGVAHDFNNVLAVIMGNLELAAVANTPEETADFNATALHACLQGKALTQQLLAFGRKSQLRPQASDVNSIVHELLPMLKRTIPESIEIRADLGLDLPTILVDRGLLETSLLNLVINARDAMTDGGCILFSTSVFAVTPLASESELKGLQPGAHVRLVVSDTGTGIPHKNLARVFDPFFSTKKFGKGHGMGLSMVRGFAEQSGGIARVYSEQGQGTSIHLYFPILAKEQPITTDPSDNVQTEKAERRTILVIEDNPDVRRMAVLQLKHLGHSTIEAGTAKEGLSILSSGVGVDLVLTDAIMPGQLQGKELARQLSNDPNAPPVIVMSGYYGSNFEAGSAEPADFEIIQKPLTIRDLEAALMRAFI